MSEVLPDEDDVKVLAESLPAFLADLREEGVVLVGHMPDMLALVDAVRMWTDGVSAPVAFETARRQRAAWREVSR